MGLRVTSLSLPPPVEVEAEHGCSTEGGDFAVQVQNTEASVFLYRVLGEKVGDVPACTNSPEFRDYSTPPLARIPVKDS